MPTITKFEDIEAWKDARALSRAIYSCCKQKPLSSDFGLCDQLRRAGVSIMANTAEGFGRGGSRELIQFLSLAKGSTLELKSHFYVMLDVEYINETVFQDLYQRADKIEALLSGFMAYLNRSDIRGRKFKP
jgi:four helix bundle protein